MAKDAASKDAAPPGDASKGNGDANTSDGSVLPGTRDPAYWPFAQTSPFNYPIGSNARYAPPTMALDPSGFWFAISDQSGPQVAVPEASSQSGTLIRSNTDSPSNYSTNTFIFPIRSDIYNPPCCSGDADLTVVMPDHRVAFDSEGSKYAGGTVTNGATSAVVDLMGPGWGPERGLPRGYFPSAMYPMATGPSVAYAPDGFGPRASSIALTAGDLRPGELKNGIRHALSGSMAYNGAAPGVAGGQCWVWPATSADGNVTSAGCPSNGDNIYMGSLLAIPPTVGLNRLGLKTPEGLTLALALQHYGLYIVDGGPQMGPHLLADQYAQGDIPGDSLYTGGSSRTDFSADLLVLVKQLQVVTNSFEPTAGGPPRMGIKIDGGDGALPVPLAPPFDAQWGGGNGRP